MKKLLVLLLALAMVFTLCACGGDSDSKKTDDKKTEETKSDKSDKTDGTKATETTKVTEPAKKEKVTSTVKVVDENNQPVAGAKLNLVLIESYVGTTDPNGVVTYTAIEDDYIIQVAEMPNGYKADRMNYYFEEGSREMTIQVKSAVAQACRYTVEVVDESGAPVAGARVNFSKESGDAHITTRDDGIASLGTMMADITITVEAPEGYAADTTAYKFAEGSFNMTIVLKTA